MTSKDETIKIYTFESNSAGGIMAILLYVKANFKVKKLDVDEWDVKKNKFEYEALPIIKINKVQYTHEIPIILYLGKKYNLLGDDVENEYLCSNILYAINELKEKILPSFLPESKEEYENQQINIDELLEVTFPFYLKKIEKHLEGKQFFFGDKISVLDIYVTFFIYLIFKHPLRANLLEPILRENAPNVDNLTNSLVQNELKDYFLNYFQINSPL